MIPIETKYNDFQPEIAELVISYYENFEKFVLANIYQEAWSDYVPSNGGYFLNTITYEVIICFLGLENVHFVKRY